MFENENRKRQLCLHWEKKRIAITVCSQTQINFQDMHKKLNYYLGLKGQSFCMNIFWRFICISFNQWYLMYVLDVELFMREYFRCVFSIVNIEVEARKKFIIIKALKSF